MPESPAHNDGSDNELSSTNENSNSSEIKTQSISSQTSILRPVLQISATAYSQNSSSSSSSLANNLANCMNSNSNQNSNASNSSANSKKFRHQNFSKNIYIGTRNAERWDNLRNFFQFKNDVEFVSFLLSTAENEARNKNKPEFDTPPTHKNESMENYANEQSSSTFPHRQQQPFPSLQMKAQTAPKKTKRVQFEENVNVINDEKPTVHDQILKKPVSSENNAQDHSISSTIDGSVSSEESNTTTEILDCRIEEKIKNELEEKQKMIENGRVTGDNSRKSRYDEAPTPPPISSSLIEKQMLSEIKSDEMSEEGVAPIQPILSKRRFYDIRKAPTMLDGKIDEMSEQNNDNSVFDFKDDEDDDDGEGRLEINSDFMIRDRKSLNKKSYKSKQCFACNTKHGKELCPIRNPTSSIINKIDFLDWVRENPQLLVEPPRPEYDKDEPLEDEKMIYEEMKSETDIDDLEDDLDDGEDMDEKSPDPNDEILDEISFAEASLPNELEFLPSKTYPNCNNSIYTKIVIPKYTQFGPLVGVITPETEIPDDCNMAFMFEIHDSILSKSIYFNTENKQKSNWMRYLQPARARDQRNLTMIRIEDKVYFVSCMDIDVGCELLYWSDDSNSAWGKKKIEKTSCGGCNLRFEHPLHYRTHCSVFHDPGFSLTIRKYHCKICSVAVLGKENIMKHAEKLHEGKGAYQCQYCRKFFLRLNYLEMHRTYGCAANPQRARPLCDFCGRKFCQPQKLKIHIKRMHSDMAEVLRDFQCKLCSKLLGSRAALQRHSKEVHSRNSAVVSCPRCQKLFQNRSNLKIHMLTHSGVRPFKCAEHECTAAFTTKQCLQFHYKKVHGFTQEQMPKIERSVAYTFDAYSGGLQTDLTGVSRRQRKAQVEAQKLAKGIPPREGMIKDKTFLSSITDLCKNETNLNLLSSKISSILSCNIKEMNKKFMTNGSTEGDVMEDESEDFRETYDESMNASEIDEKMMAEKNMRSFLQQRQDDGMLNESISGNETNDIDNEDDEADGSESDRNSFKTPINRRFLQNPQNLIAATSPRFKDFLFQSNPNLVISKGSKKWMNDNMHPHQMMNDSDENEVNLMTQANRDFLAKLISSKLNKGTNQNRIEASDHSPVLDVVDMNNHQSQNQQQDQENSQYDQSFNEQQDMVENNNIIMDNIHHFQNNSNNSVQNNSSFNTHFNPLGNFYSGSSNGNRNIGGSIPSASLLVEAALSSVSNMIGSNDISNNDNESMAMNDSENHHQDMTDDMSTSEFQSSHNIITTPVDENSKIMKAHSFAIHLPSMNTFDNNGATNMITENNEIEVGASTPKNHYTPAADKSENVNTPFPAQPNDSCSPVRALTPDSRNYNNNNNNFSSQRNSVNAQIPASPGGPLSARPIYGSENDLVSPASTPSLPRYDFSSENYRRRDKNMEITSNEEYQKNIMQNIQQHQHHPPQIAHISSDEENSIVIAENLSVNHQNQNDKIKLDLIYPNNSKFEHPLTPQSNHMNRESLNDIRSKYNDQGQEIQEFARNMVANDIVTTSGNGSEYQGLDMSSRGSLGGYHSHNFQLPPSAGTNLSFNRYQHHIYDILTERDQQNQSQQQQQDHHPFQIQQQQQQQQQQQLQHLLQEHISHDHESDQIQSGVDLSRASNTYIVPSSSPHLPYSHAHSEMLRMASLDLSTGNNSATTGIIGSNNSHHVRHHSTFLAHPSNREIADHTRFLASDQRLLVDPTAHLLLEQNNRLFSSENNRILDQSRLLTEGPSNRHVVSPRGFGAYHHPHHSHSHHQIKYHQNATSNQQQNYHPFSTSYY